MNDTLRYYEKNAAPLCTRYETAQLSELHTLLLSMFRREERVLELGSGSGRDGAFLLAQDYDWTGIEGAKAMAAESLALHPELGGRVLCREMQRPLPFPDAYFGGCFSFAALMHLEAPQVWPVLRETGRVLMSGSPLVVSVPLSRTDVDNTGVDAQGRYFLPWNKEEWCTVFSATGFEITECTVTNDSLGRPITWLNLVTCKNARATAT